MSRKGDCWDNAPMESLNGIFKVECVRDENFETREPARQAIVEYLGYYNTSDTTRRWAISHRRISSGADAPSH